MPAMLAGGGGSLVHLGSDSARLPEIGNLDYAAAKLPLLALSTSLATEFSPQGIRSNIVVPGPTRTPLYDRPGGFGDQAAELWGTDKETAITRMVTEIRPLLTGRMGKPDDIAQVVAYLVSPLSRQVTAADGASTAARSATSNPTTNTGPGGPCYGARAAGQIVQIEGTSSCQPPATVHAALQVQRSAGRPRTERK